MDGLNLLVGTEMGTVGVLDVVTQKYETVVRSHDGGILSCCRVNDNVATVGLDCTVRVWEIHSRRQEKEFVSLHDEPRTIEYHPFQDVIACGFVSGFVRIFSLESISTLFELEQHTGVVKCLKYTKDGNLLYSAATDGHISIYDVTQDYLPIKTIACDVPSSCVKMCLSDCGSYLAAVGPELHAVTVYEARSLVVVKKLVRAGEEKVRKKSERVRERCYAQSAPLCSHYTNGAHADVAGGRGYVLLRRIPGDVQHVRVCGQSG